MCFKLLCNRAVVVVVSKWVDVGGLVGVLVGVVCELDLLPGVLIGVGLSVEVAPNHGIKLHFIVIFYQII